MTIPYRVVLVLQLPSNTMITLSCGTCFKQLVDFKHRATGIGSLWTISASGSKLVTDDASPRRELYGSNSEIVHIGPLEVLFRVQGGFPGDMLRM